MTAPTGLPLVAVHARQQRDRRHPAGRARSPRSCKAAGGVLVLDAVQAAGRIPLDMADGLRGFPHSLRAQDRRTEGRRRAVVARVGPDDAGAAGPRRRAGEGPSRRHREPCGIAGFGAAARVAPERLARADELRAHARPDRGGDRAARARRGDFRRGAPSALPTRRFFAMPGLKAETAQIALRSRGRCGFGRFGLLVGQGRAKPCAEGDGPSARRTARCAFRSARRRRRTEIERFAAALAADRGAPRGRPTRPPERRP